MSPAGRFFTIHNVSLLLLLYYPCAQVMRVWAHRECATNIKLILEMRAVIFSHDAIVPCETWRSSLS